MTDTRMTKTFKTGRKKMKSVSANCKMNGDAAKKKKKKNLTNFQQQNNTRNIQEQKTAKMTDQTVRMVVNIIINQIIKR